MEHMGAALSTLSVFRPILRTPVMKRCTAFFQALARGAQIETMACYTDIFYTLTEAGSYSLGSYLSKELQYLETPFSRAAARGEAPEALWDAAKRDIEILNRLIGLDYHRLLHSGADTEEYDALIRSLPSWAPGPPLELEALAAGYRENGYGLFARGKSFLWEDGALRLASCPDEIDAAALYGYEWQRRAVYQNTRLLLKGGPAANVLLYGDSGTGKSVTVKSQLQFPEFSGLRIIEISRAGIPSLHRLMEQLEGECQRFILFIDDLSFDGDDTGFSVLKSILEGGVGRRPRNAAVYATSNRRHMVRETFGDRAGDDVHAAETIQEKTSLSDRFGLRIPYLALSRDEYLACVRHLTERAGAVFDDAAASAAMRWEIAHGGRTPRVAKQFVEQSFHEASC